jgi:glucose-6-phosphate 1-dehydrogenase
VATIVEATPVQQVSTPSLPKADKCTLVIFGGTGDLTRRKLIPALFDLACIGCLSSVQFEIVALGRKPLSNEQFVEELRQAASQSKDARDFSDEKWHDFAKRIHYLQADTGDERSFVTLKKTLEDMERSGASPNHLFYLSTPASVFEEIVLGLGSAGLAKSERGWVRIVIEKPFGHDLTSAHKLNDTLLQVFDEKDIYRIDHYLGKETVQNILVFRFGNSLFEPVWNRNYVDYVEITAAETLGVESRAGFYEETGALRDMVANHMMQLLTLTAMEPPVAFDADSVREQKVQVLRAIHPMTLEQVAERTVRGQYGQGIINGQRVPGYREEPGVDPHSTTETYVALQLFIDNWRWARVPFCIRTGKRLSRSLTEIRVHFKRTPQALFARTPEEQLDPNIITFRIQPNEGITVNFGAKYPGTQMRTGNVQFDFSYKEAFGVRAPVAYETLLLDAMRGDATLFTRRDEVEAEWRLITPIEEAWKELPPPRFPNYAAGSDGPEEAARLMNAPCREWRPLAA